MSLFHHMRKISQELHRDLGNDVDVISTLLSFYDACLLFRDVQIQAHYSVYQSYTSIHPPAHIGWAMSAIENLVINTYYRQ